MWWPYVGAGLAGGVSGLLNPIDLTRRLVLPVASSFGAGFGLTRIPYLLPPRPVAGEPLVPVARRPGSLAVLLVAVLAAAVLLASGIPIER
jgi:hypothetical protein